ncbi:hypothetical protein E3P94_03802 [Wallemia ichthyophaga]|nr:hypothetical protein E3P95_03807 [Wallemia ichthyophaga]TIA96150.1 hypothetical protein E3P94_03802 [Wallemia ichthyophaga]
MVSRSGKSTPDSNSLASYTQSLNLSSNTPTRTHPYASEDYYSGDTISASDGLASIDCTQTDFFYNQDMLGIPQPDSVHVPLNTQHPYQISRPPSLTSLSTSDKTSISSTKRFEPPSPNYPNQSFEPPPKFSRLAQFNKAANGVVNLNGDTSSVYSRALPQYSHHPSPLSYTTTAPSDQDLLGLPQQYQSNMPCYPPVPSPQYSSNIPDYYNSSYYPMSTPMSQTPGPQNRKSRSSSVSQNSCYSQHSNVSNMSNHSTNSRVYGGWGAHQPQLAMTGIRQSHVPAPTRISSLDHTQLFAPDVTQIESDVMSSTPMSGVLSPDMAYASSIASDGASLSDSMSGSMSGSVAPSIATSMSAASDTGPMSIRPMPIRKRAQTLATSNHPMPPYLRQSKNHHPSILETMDSSKPRPRSRSSTMSSGDDGSQMTSFNPELKDVLDDVFFQFMNDLCSDLGATDSRGELIHQTLMAKKMEKLDQLDEFRPFKFRIQAFTSAFQDRLLQHNIDEGIMPSKRVKVYLWSSPFISRFNEDGKKAKSKGNHIWNISAKKDRHNNCWVFEEFSPRITGEPPKVAYIGVPWSFTPRLWDPRNSFAQIKPTFSSPALPPWLSWVSRPSTRGSTRGEIVHTLTGIPDVTATTSEIVIEATYVYNGLPHKLSKTFILYTANQTSLPLQTQPTGLPTIKSSPIDTSAQGLTYSPSPEHDEMQ